jgi:EmrB/QacA subfamily drug resistance transporter
VTVPAVSHPRKWAILAIVLCVECMDLLDATIVNVAMPHIRADLGASASALQWIAGGYALALSVGLVTGGRLGDIAGHRRTFLLGTLGFVIASLLCALAPGTGLLIAARLLQGLACAIVLPQGFGIIRSTFAAEDQQQAFAVFGPVIGLSAVLGPIVGGLLVDANVAGQDWRTVFLVNVPIGVVALIGAYRLLPESRETDPPTLDLVGTVLIGLVAGLLVYPLIQGREAGWPWWTWAMFAAAAVLLVSFAQWVRTKQEDPLVTPSLFAKQQYDAGLGIMFLFFGGLSGVMLVLTLYMQLGQRFSAIHAGLSFAPWSLAMAVGAGLSGGVLGPRYGRTVLQAGAVLCAAGNLLLIWSVHTHPLTTSTAWFAGPLVVYGLGMGLFVAPAFDIVLASVSDEETGSASGVLNANQQLAAAVGVAVMGTIFFGALTGRGFVVALERVLWVQLAVIAAIVVVSPLLPRRAREEAHGAPAAELAPA